MKFIGIDIGTTMIKGQLIDNNGLILCTSEFPSPSYIKESVHYVSAEKTERIATEIIINLTKDYKGEASFICFSCFGEAFVLIDKEGNPLNDFILYVSNLGDCETKRIKSKIDSDCIAGITGVYPHKMFSLSKLMWLKRKQPQIYKRTWKMLMVAPYLVYKFTGSAVCDYSLASRTMCFDIRKKEWSSEIISAAGLDMNIFPPLKLADEIAGTIKCDLAEKLGVSSSCSILVSGHDQMMAALGSGMVLPGMANDGMGTAECVTLLLDKIPSNRDFFHNNFCVVPYIIPGLYITYAFITTGGALLEWHKDKLSPLEARVMQSEKRNYFQEYSKADVSLPTSLLVLPHFSGSGTPFLDNKSKGVIIGLTQETTKEEIFFALMEGATYEINLNICLLKKFGFSISSLSATGGGSKSLSWLQIKSNVFNRDIKVLSSSEGGIFGCFIMMLHRANQNESYEALASRYVTTNFVIMPNAALSNLYKYKFVLYKRIYPALTGKRRIL